VLSNGTAPLTSYFNGTGVQWIRGGAPLTYVPPKEGAVPVPVYLQTVAGSTQQQLEVAHDMINEMLSPKWCTRWATTTVSTPANVKSKLPPKLARLPAFSTKTIENFQTVDYGVVGKKNVAWQQRWDQDVESKI
jgi:putative spermidine/putrescine transport system substrate-binding protein